MGSFEILLHHVTVRRAGTVHATERGDGGGNGARQVGAADADANGAGGRRRHRMLEENAHLVPEHLLFFFRRDPVLEQNEHGVGEGIALLGQVA